MLFTAKTWFEDFFESIHNLFSGDGEYSFNALEKIFLIIVILLLSYLVIKLVQKVLEKVFKVKSGLEIDKSAKTFIIQAIKFFLWLFVSFFVLAVLNIDMSSFAGILSAITVALGLSLQDLISGFASGILILKQKNYITGDYIEVSNSYGTVEGEIVTISIFYTNLKTWNGQIIIVPNSNMLKANVTNYTKEKIRRYVITLKCDLDTDIDKAKEVLMNIASNDDRLTNEKAPLIFLEEIGDYSLNISLKMWAYMDKYWDVYLDTPEKVVKAFRENNIKLAKTTNLTIENK